VARLYLGSQKPSRQALPSDLVGSIVAVLTFEMQSSVVVATTVEMRWWQM